MYKGVNI